MTDVLAEYKPASDAPEDFVAYAVVCSRTDKKKYSMLKAISTKLAADLECKFAIARITKVFFLHIQKKCEAVPLF